MLNLPATLLKMQTHSQSVKEGTKVKRGTSITVYFRDDSVTDFIPE